MRFTSSFILLTFLNVCLVNLSFVLAAANADDLPLNVGIAEKDITPPVGYPLAGYFHERLAEGQLDPLKAKAMVIRQGSQSFAVAFCDLTGIATDLTHAVRLEITQRSDIKPEQIVLCATHSHTAPDYYRDLFLHLSEKVAVPSTDYPAHLIEQISQCILDADRNCRPVEVKIGSADQQAPVSFNRRFVMRDGSVKTWQKLANPQVIRAAGPIDSVLSFCSFQSHSTGEPIGVLSNFALHLDTVGGNRWSADFPYFIEQTLSRTLGKSAHSLFGLGCCGDINHVDPSQSRRNKTEFIGRELGQTLLDNLASASSLEIPRLGHQHDVVALPLRPVTLPQAARSRELMMAAKEGLDVEFFELVRAYKTVVLAQFQNKNYELLKNTAASWGLSHQLSGCGNALPVEVHSICLGPDFALVFLPGEVFVELGLAIKQASPFKQTIVIELANSVETAYLPTQAAFAGGSYEVTNSTTQPGSGEKLVEQALKQLGKLASALQASSDP